MMRMKTKMTGLSPLNGSSDGGGRDGGGGGGRDGGGAENDWELRPGGMLVQKRDPDSDQNRVPPLTIRVRVKYGSIYHEINISSQASFGELKKMLTGPTGLHHEDQKLLFKDRERDSKAFLDVAGVKDRSKMVLFEDPIRQERRLLEMRRTAKLEKSSKSISDISLEVDRLAGQVSAIESVISRGAKFAEKDVQNLTELLMNQLIKLDGIFVDGDVKLQRKMQVKRVQKYVETLDMLKIKNSMPSNNVTKTPVKPSPTQQPQQQKYSNGQVSQSPIQSQNHQHKHSNGQSRNSTPSGAVVITTQWETFDSAPSAPPSTSTTTNNHSPHPKFNWDLL